MGIRKRLLTGFIFCFGAVSGQQTEQQWKYVMSNGVSKQELLEAKQKSDDFSLLFHSNYTYYDLYLETPDFLLYKNQLGLRLRKRIISDSVSSYSMQLKSEMTVQNDLRMEIEEDLTIYKVKRGDQFVPLTKVMDTIFSLYGDQKSEEDVLRFNRNIGLVQDWLRMKVDSPISAYQKLKFLHPQIFSSQSLSTLQPLVCCKSYRERGHVYIDRNSASSFKAIAPNRKAPGLLPELFKVNSDYVWIMEVSYDMTEGQFISGSKSGQKISICEFEVENKYSDQQLGTTLMNEFEKELMSEVKLIKGYDSKYAQMVKVLLN